MQGFVATLSTSPSAYMVSHADCEALQLAVNAYAVAHLAATNEATRTKSAVSLKDQTRNSAEQLCRQYATMIKHNCGISDQAKIDARVRPENRGRQKIECPMTSPAINVIAATPGVHTLRYNDAMTPESSAKPFGAVGLELFIAVGDAPVTDPKEARLYGRFTRNPVTVNFAASDDRKKVTYFGRWTSQRGGVGPWSIARSFTIAA